MADQYRIVEAQLPLVGGIGGHNLLVVLDTQGNVIKQLNGLATGTDGKIKPIGYLPSDKLYVYDTENYYRSDEPQITLYTGSYADVMGKWNAALDCSIAINNKNLPYPFFGLGKNSNSVANTLVQCMGLSQQPMPGSAFLTPGSKSILLDQSTINGIQQNNGIAPTKINPFDVILFNPVDLGRVYLPTDTFLPDALAELAIPIASTMLADSETSLTVQELDNANARQKLVTEWNNYLSGLTGTIQIAYNDTTKAVMIVAGNGIATINKDGSGSKFVQIDAQNIQQINYDATGNSINTEMQFNNIGELSNTTQTIGANSITTTVDANGNLSTNGDIAALAASGYGLTYDVDSGMPNLTLLDGSGLVIDPIFQNPNPSVEPIGAFYEVTTLANDNAASIAGITGQIIQNGAAISKDQLAALDTNNDSAISSADSAYNQLNIWQDTNENGTKDAGEVITLAQSGLAGIRSEDYAQYTAGNAVDNTATIPAPTRLNPNTVAPARIDNQTINSDWYINNSNVTKFFSYGGQIGWFKDGIKVGINGTTAIGTNGNDSFDASSFSPYFNPNNITTFIAGAGNDVMGGNSGNNTMFGGIGNDLLLGYQGNDVIYGEDGCDELQGGEGDDRLYGDAGDDRIFGQAGNDMSYGGIGNDEIQGGDGNDQLIGEAGDDRIFGQTGDDTIWGGDGNDVLVGFTGSNETKQTLASGETDNDTIYGGSGADIIVAGLGDDKLFGEDGDDYISGDNGNDYIDGGIGNDTMLAGTGDDTVFGGSGNDEIQGGDGNDQLIGEVGDDKIFGQTGDDKIWGGDGNDILVGFTATNELIQALSNGETDNDIICGENGDDLIIAGLGNDIAFGGNDNDREPSGSGQTFCYFL